MRSALTLVFHMYHVKKIIYCGIHLGVLLRYNPSSSESLSHYFLQVALRLISQPTLMISLNSVRLNYIT